MTTLLPTLYSTSARYAATLLRLLLAFVIVGALSAPASAQLSFDYALNLGPVPETGQRTVADSQGNSYVAGTYRDSIRLGSITLYGTSFSKFYVARFDPSGHCVWATQAGGSGGETITDIALDAAGDLLIVGATSSQPAQFGSITFPNQVPSAGIIAKIDARGRWRWVHGIGSGNSGIEFRALALDAQANLYLTGRFVQASATFGNITIANPSWASVVDASHLFVARFDSTGACQWAVGGAPNAGGFDLAVDGRGKVWIAGWLYGTGVFGTTRLTSAGDFDMLVAQLDAATGAWHWVQRMGGSGYEDMYALALDTTGHAYLTGTFASTNAQFGALTRSSAGSSDLFVARLQSSGAVDWVTTGGSSTETIGRALAVDAAGAAYVTGNYLFGTGPVALGSFILPLSGTSDVFVAKLDSLGAFAWATRISSSASDHATDICLAGPADDVLVTGWFEGSTGHFAPLTLAGDSDVWKGYVARLSNGPVLARSVAPTSGVAGQTVTITGSRLAGVTAVYFDGVPAPAFTVLSATALLATVPTGAGSGPVTVRTAAGMSSPGPVFQLNGLATAPASREPALVVWPTPGKSNEPIYIQLGPATTALSYTLRTPLGQLVHTGELRPTTTRLDAGTLRPGIYILTVADPLRGPLVQRIVVE